VSTRTSAGLADEVDDAAERLDVMFRAHYTRASIA
jgi:hypothetical protein